VPEAQVVGGEREPGLVGLADARRHRFLEEREVARAAHDAVARVEAVGDLQAVGGLVGEHHEAANAGGGGRRRVPVRFLVAEGRDEAPVDAAHPLGLLEVRAQLRQHRSYLLQ